MCIGVGEIAVASKLMKVIKAIDLVVSATDIAITMNETAIHNLQGGDEFIEKWTLFSIAAGIGNLSAEKFAENAAANTEDIVKGVVEKWAQLKKAYKNNPEKLIEAVGVNEFKKIEEITNNAVTEMEAAEIALDNAEDLNEIYAKALIENAGHAGESLTALEILKSKLSDNLSEFLVKFEQLGSLKVSNRDEILLIVKTSGSEEAIGKIVSSKLTVTKQLDQGTVIAEAEGYQLVKNGDSYGFRSIAKGAGYLDNLPRYQQLFKEGKISELFSELKKTTAFPKMGKTSKLSHESLLAKYKADNGKYYPNFDAHNNYPYSVNSPVTKYKLEETAYFVRLYSDDAIASKWVFRIEDLRQYGSLEEAIEKLAIPFDNGTLWGKIPNKIALVEIPGGTELIKSAAGKQIWKRELDGLPDLVQQGGGFQYEVINYNSTWFKEIKGGSFNDIISNQ